MHGCRRQADKGRRFLLRLLLFYEVQNLSGEQSVCKELLLYDFYGRDKGNERQKKEVTEMSINNIPDSNYIHIERWMYKLGLNLTEMAVFACIHGFCLDGKSVFSGSVEYLQAWSNASRSKVFETLKKLTEQKLVIKRCIEKDGRTYPVYYTVRSRQMFQEMADKNELIKTVTKFTKKSASPKSGLKVQKKGVSVQNLDSDSPESGRNNIALKVFKKAAADETADSFISEKIRECLGIDTFSSRFKRTLKQKLLLKGFEEAQIGEYISFVSERVREKEPESIPALFTTLVLADDVVREFITDTGGRNKQERESSSSASKKVMCPCCGALTSPYLGSCHSCDFNMDDMNDDEKIRRAKMIREMPEESRVQMEAELSKLYEHFDIRKFTNLVEIRKRNLAAEEIYRKYGIAVGRAGEVGM